MTKDNETNDLATAFERLVEEPGFAASVVNDADGALASYTLSDEEREALVADAAALEDDDEVVGFSQRTMAHVMSFGGLRTPRLLGGSFFGGGSIAISG